SKAIQLALQGDLQALRLCLERLLPPCKERRIDLPLPDVRTSQDTSAALSTVLAAVGDGRITPGEGQTVTEIVEARTRLIQVEDHDRRIAKLEKALPCPRIRIRIRIRKAGDEQGAAHSQVGVAGLPRRRRRVRATHVGRIPNPLRGPS